MCLLLAAWRLHPRFDLVIAANRDELHARPALAMDFWAGPAPLLAGVDLSAGGTWLGVDRAGRFGAVTNFHERPEPGAPAHSPAGEPPVARPSRGRLVVDYLGSSSSAGDWLHGLGPGAARFAGFNLVVADRDALWYASNRASPFAQQLPPGLYAVSNHLLDTPWPKVRRARQALTAWIDAGRTDPAPLWDLLRAEDAAPEEGLPWPASSGPFVRDETYGTRSSTWMTREPGGHVRVGEENFDAHGRSLGRVRFSLDPASVL
jgi:uncharacterized protein with NRDE domain